MSRQSSRETTLISLRAITIVLLTGLGTVACQTAPAPDAGFLTAYEGLAPRTDTLRASIRERRDDAAMAAVDSLFIERTTLHPGAAKGLTERDIGLVLGEIDRQLCFELSERFDILDAPGAAEGRVRTAVTRISPTDPAGSTVAAAANFFIPGPIGLRLPGSTGGLAVESEVIGRDGTQLAALAWARSATAVGMDDPSLSRVGDALQFAEAFGDQAGDTFAPEDRSVRDIPEPDPCARFGARINPAGFVAGLVTGLYVPEAEGVRDHGEDAPPEE